MNTLRWFSLGNGEGVPFINKFKFNHSKRAASRIYWKCANKHCIMTD